MLPIEVRPDLCVERADGSGHRFWKDGWATMLRLAIDYGWKPEHDRGAYVAGNRLTVSAGDARALGVAIHALLDDAVGDAEGVGWEDLDRVCEHWDAWCAFASFCRHGGFEIRAGDPEEATP
jgi:hypothetical protein